MSSLIPYYRRITEPYPETGETTLGFGEYTDGLSSQGVPFVVNQGQTLQIPNDASGVVQSNVTIPYYDGDRIRLTRALDSYILRVSFTAFSTVPLGVCVIKLDDSVLGDGSGSTNDAHITGMTGTTSIAQQSYSVTIPFYATQNIVSNGGTVLIQQIGGGSRLFNIKFSIFKLHGSTETILQNPWLDEFGDQWVDEFGTVWTN